MSSGKPLDGKKKQQILDLLILNHLTPKQIALQVGLHVNRVYDVTRQHPLFTWLAKQDKED